MLSKFFGKAPVRSARARFARLNLESLESRETPAGGVVTANVVGGTLTLTGDNNAAGNHVRLLSFGVGAFDVQGQNGTLVRLGAGAPAGSVNVTGVTLDIRANFFDGPDRFEYTQLNEFALRDVYLTMGKGNDTILIAGGFIDCRNITITQNALDVGNDSTTITNPLGNNGGIRGFININNGQGNDTTILSVKATGNVTVASQTGNDVTRIEGASYIGGSVLVTNTTGAIGNDTRIQGTTHISKNLTVTNGNQEQINQILGACVIGGNVVFASGNAGGGTTQNNVNNAVIGGTFTATGTGGQNWTNITNSRVGRTVTINSGPGNAFDTLNNSTVGGSYISNKGAGNDNLTINSSAIYGNLTLSMGATSMFGANVVDIDNSSVYGTTTITATTGEDRVFIDTSRFIGAVNINTGAANDVVEIGVGGGTNTFFYSTLTVALGTGVDQLRVGTGSSIRVTGNTAYSGILGETLIDNVNPFANVYLGTRTVS
jgi:hypothetical protein